LHFDVHFIIMYLQKDTFEWCDLNELV